MLNTARQFSAALFDLDGTLVDTEPRSQAAWARLFRTHGVPHDERLLASFAGRPGKQVLAEHLHSFPGRTVEELFAEALSYATLPAAPVSEVVDVLRALHREGIPVGVVTSGTADYARGELAAIGVLPLLGVLITADDVTEGKPAPEGYLAGCRALGVEPARAVVFEDAPAGIAAAKAAGAYCIALTTTQPAAALAGADEVVDPGR
ncbi:HAD family phosphatase [Saccharopolyspora taberi]|uniref:Sugar phosphatase n=1 Tax=Saccharopolyspora taberi TaxID=60895 RepID=A0ABN3VKW1_9PSEU